MTAPVGAYVSAFRTRAERRTASSSATSIDAAVAPALPERDRVVERCVELVARRDARPQPRSSCDGAHAASMHAVLAFAQMPARFDALALLVEQPRRGDVDRVGAADDLGRLFRRQPEDAGRTVA